MKIISLKDFSFTYPGEAAPALHSVTLDVMPGEFVVVCGETGSGKTTLLRTLKPEIAPVGRSEGTLELPASFPGDMNGAPTATCDDGNVVGVEFIRPEGRHGLGVGFVSQDPEAQIVMDTVRAELAFGLENLGVEPGEIRRRVAEVATFFGIDAWIDQRTHELSGGQKQILNVASVLVMQPTVLVLDEPTAQLDPIATRDFLNLIDRVNSELGIAVVMSEHRLEDVLAMADRAMLMERGEVILDLPPHEFAQALYERESSFAAALPPSTRFAHEWGERERLPLTVKEARKMIADSAGLSGDRPLRQQENGHLGNNFVVPHSVRNDVGVDPPIDPMVGARVGGGAPALTAKHLWFRYERTDDFVLSEVSLDVARGEIHALLGGNGSGKTTLLNLIAGTLKPSRGKVVFAQGLVTGVLPQDPKTLFASDTVYGELDEWRALKGYSGEDIQTQLERFGLTPLRDRHPYDLSGGEMQKLALAKVLLLAPTLLLLDEPTKGVDAAAKNTIAQVLLELKEAGITILLVTHDLEFADHVADRCSLLFDGEMVSTESTATFFDSNLFYTTEQRRVMQGMRPTSGRQGLPGDRPLRQSANTYLGNDVGRSPDRPEDQRGHRE